MGIYDPTYSRRPFAPVLRAGEVPGSLVLGKTGNKGCIWPAQGGKWFAARPDHNPGEPYPSFDDRDVALAYIVDPVRREHQDREDAREAAWRNAAPKRAARAERSKAREEKRLERKRKKGEKVWLLVLNGNMNEPVGRVARVTQHEALQAAASLLGYSILPEGYDVVPVAD